MRRKPAVAAVIAGVLGGCTVGPNFKTPAPPATSGYSKEPLPSQIGADATHAEAQRFVMGMDIPGQWWTLFHSTALDDLVQEGYLKKVPVDPFTKRSDTWVPVEDDSMTNIDQTQSAIDDVHSGSQQTASDGTAYSTW